MIVTVTTLVEAFRHFEFGKGPLYKSIAYVIAKEIKAGRIAVGERLPPHRELAMMLGVTIGTITRAYSQLIHDGLVSAGVGRGSFVTRKEASRMDALTSTDGIDLATNQPVIGPQAARLGATLTELGSRVSGLNLGYSKSGGDAGQRLAGAQLLATHGVHVDSEQVIVTNGSQAALVALLSALGRPGDTVCVERLCYPGIVDAARRASQRVVGVAIDEEGIVPESLIEACTKHAPRLLVTVPTYHNPTGAVMSLQRRERIVEIARDHDLLLIEDDAYRFLIEGAPPPLAALAPERTCYIAGTSKCLLPALRVAFVAVPPGHVKRVSTSAQCMGWMASPMNGEIVRHWLDNGTFEALVKWQRDELRNRTELARTILGSRVGTAEVMLHSWLPLPPHWDAESMTEELRQQWVSVAAASAFVAGSGTAPEAIRICLAGGPSLQMLERALLTIRDVLGKRAHAVA